MELKLKSNAELGYTASDINHLFQAHHVCLPPLNISSNNLREVVNPRHNLS
jgi:hypothetical protein